MAQVAIYTKCWCPYCVYAKARLEQLGVAFDDIDVTDDRAREREMIDRAGRTSVPQIFVGTHHVGGSDDLEAAIASGEFEKLLRAGDEASAA
ncbi:MAG: glutaredoxin 3 [Pseudomonadota bacterium]